MKRLPPSQCPGCPPPVSWELAPIGLTSRPGAGGERPLLRASGLEPSTLASRLGAFRALADNKALRPVVGDTRSSSSPNTPCGLPCWSTPTAAIAGVVAPAQLVPVFAAVVEVTSQPGTALTVSNTGQCVPAEQVSALFEPFRRLTADRTDHGGGAAGCQARAEVHPLLPRPLCLGLASGRGGLFRSAAAACSCPSRGLGRVIFLVEQRPEKPMALRRLDLRLRRGSGHLGRAWGAARAAPLRSCRSAR
jgi:hypothetical protein